MIVMMMAIMKKGNDGVDDGGDAWWGLVMKGMLVSTWGQNPSPPRHSPYLLCADLSNADSSLLCESPIYAPR